MNEYEKRKLLLDATLAIAKEREIDFSDKGQVSEAVAMAKSLLEEIEENISDINFKGISYLDNLDGVLAKKSFK